MLRALAVAGLVLSPCPAFCQSPAPRPEFEVASIKLNKSADMRMMVRPAPGGRFTVTNVPVQLLITMAYRIKDFQLSGAPPWVTSERYDVEAKADGNPEFDAMLPMLQTLLEDRLKFKFHRESKEMSVYALLPENSTSPKANALRPRMARLHRPSQAKYLHYLAEVSSCFQAISPRKRQR
jgi:uncharacterized protein (TIGR03435 family)